MFISKYYLQRIYLLLLMATPLAASAQVSGVSYTLSPSANYTFWDDQAGLTDGLLAGGHLGIGFGENVELRGMYLFDLGLKTNFDDFGLAGSTDNLAEREVNLTRYGGEVRLNIGRSRLLPFLTLGAGIQRLELDGGKENEHIFASGGLGINLRVADRFTFKIEGKNTAYNFNSVRNLMTVEDRDQLGIDLNDFERERLSNWSVGAGLTVYLGGRRPGTLSEVDRAYSEAFSNGFRNISLLVEPTVSRISFDDALPYNDMYLAGGNIGLDFGPLVGFRAFYLQGMENDELSLDFDDIALYGADFRFRFSSVTTGLSPFVSLGGGYIDAADEYIGRDGQEGVGSQAFASGGVGASLNLGRNFRITGNYKALLMTSGDVEELESTDEIRTSGQWSVGLNLAFGKKAKRPDAMFTSIAKEQLQRERTVAALEQQTALNEQAQKNADATRKLRADYERKIDDLKAALSKAATQQDSMAVDSLVAEIAETEEVVEELEEREEELEETIATVNQESSQLEAELAEQTRQSEQVRQTEANRQAPAAAPFTPAPAARNDGYDRSQQYNNAPAPTGSRLSFTPAEFEGLIEEIFEGLNYGLPATPMGMLPPAEQYEVVETTQDTARINGMERQIASMQSSLEALSERQDEAEKLRIEDKAELQTQMQEGTRTILEEIRAMRAEMANKTDMSEKEMRQRDKATEQTEEKAKKEAEKAAEKAAKEAKEAAEKAAKAAEKAAKEEAKRKKKEGGGF